MLGRDLGDSVSRGAAAANKRMRTRALALALCGCLGLLSGRAAAQGTDLHIVAPSAPGTGWDQVAQALRASLAEKGGLSTSVTNVPGGGGIVGLTQFLAGQADTDLLVTGLTMLDASLLSRSAPDFGRVTPIARLSAEYFGLVVPVASPLRTMDDLRAAMVAEPAKLTWGGGPTGAVDHVAALLLADALSIRSRALNYVAFLTSAEAGAAAADEKVAAALLPLSEVQGEVTAGRLRLLGVTSLERLPGLDAPTFVEFGIPFDFSNWRGLVARPGLTPDQQARLADLVRTAIGAGPWQRMIEGRRWREAFLGPEPFQAFVRREHQRVKDALRSAGLLKRNDK